MTPPLPRRGHSLVARDIQNPALAATEAHLMVLGGTDGSGTDVLVTSEFIISRAAGTYTVKDTGSLPASLVGTAHVKLGTGPGSDDSGATEFLFLDGRVNGTVSTQQARLKVGTVYFPPVIETQPSGLLRISWPDGILGGVTLQESATLTPAESWADVPGVPVHGAGIYYLDVDPASYNGGKHFFRLKAD